MGEVYRARDTRLDRTVAIKVLTAALMASSDAKLRFEREAKAISALNHPNICTLYDVGHQDGTDFLVMEFLEGETLADRLKAKGALPLPELTRIGSEIADALDKAHRAGIVHRDLKPGNVMLTKGGAKLLDFGLAKPAAVGAAAGAGAAPLLSAAMTMTSPSPQQSPVTQQGSLVGTVQYMSPEQIQGLEADSRSDIFAFGTVLYEIATGKRAFDGKSQIKVASAILEDDPPPVSASQKTIPAAFDRLVRTCLAKNPDDRFQSARDVKLELLWAAQTAKEKAAGSERSRSGARVAWIMAVALAGLTLAAALYFRQNVQPIPVLRTTILPPGKSEFVTTPPDSGVPVLSPDGSRLAFVARDGKGLLTLHVRLMNSIVATQLSGTEGAIHPFWSPDSRNIGFFSTDGRLKRIEASGGPVQDLAPADRGRGGAWSQDGTIVYAPSINGPLMRISASGGAPAPAAKLLPGETGHRWPSMLPDGKHFVFWVRGDKTGICIGSLDSLDHTMLFENALNATYAPPGFLLFLRNQSLMAQPFSTNTFETSGDAVPIVEDVAVNRASFRGVFSTSDNGMLAYQSGGDSGTWHLQWADRDGKVIENLPGQATFLEPEISPDGKRIVVAFADLNGGSNIDVWILDTVRGTRTRLTFDPASASMPIWTPDGRRIIYISNRKGKSDIYMKSADGSGNAEVVLEDDTDKTWPSISPDGRYLAYERRVNGSTTGDDIWVLPLFGDRKPFPLVQSPFLDATPAISPDGKWLAYSSDENHRREIYITPFPDGGGKWQASTAGGLSPKWRGDSKELYFLSYDASLNAVDVSAAAGSVALGTPHPLFFDTLQGANFGPYDVSPDGKRFLLNGAGGLEGGATPLTLLTNWTAQLKR